ncbi:MAG TPA: P1 family peptidase [Hyphomonadaceae bacterium]|nr:P1 family peptidase [Hyphomonadaceae bacterium]
MSARPGPFNLITDVGGLKVGAAHDAEAVTGVTVILAERRAVAAVAVAGGGPGTRETDALGPDTLVDAVDAIVFSGGSVYGLAAADGVTAALGAAGQGFALFPTTDIPPSPIVPAAILYDLANAGDKKWGETPPYRALGMAALKDAKGQFALGRTGAGYGARAGLHPGGLGSASAATHDGIVVGALAAVNSHGSVKMPGTDVFWAWPYEQDREFGGVRPAGTQPLDLDDWGDAKSNPGLRPLPPMAGRTNTTLACVATNVALTPAEAQRVARMAQAGIARAVRPAFAPFDGDVVFCLSTGGVERPDNRPFVLARIGELAAACLARAIARGVYEAR